MAEDATAFRRTTPPNKKIEGASGRSADLFCFARFVAVLLVAFKVPEAMTFDEFVTFG